MIEEKFKNKPSDIAVQHFKDTLEKYLSALNVSVIVEVRDYPFKITSLMADKSSVAYHWLDVYISTPEIEKFRITLHLIDGIDENMDERLIWEEANIIQNEIYTRRGLTPKHPLSDDPYWKLWDFIDVK